MILAFLLAGAYAWIMRWYYRAWLTLPDWELPSNALPSTFLTVLVPARNEDSVIKECLQALLRQDYPPDLYEVIVIDDFSTDRTADRVLELPDPRISLIRLADHLAEGSKKKAIEAGIRHARGRLIVTTDADCLASPGWLTHLAAFYEQVHPKLIAAPVLFHREHNLLQRFQSLDLIGMMGITAAGIHRRQMHLANGANLAYEKSAFESVGGFAGVDSLASGDDLFLVQKMAKQFPGEIAFLKSPAAAVRTEAAPDLRSFWAQRLRWASKSGHYRERKIILVLALVFVYCWAIIIGLLTSFFWWALGLLLWKSLIDLAYLSSLSRYFDRSDLMRSFVPAQFLHILYVSFIGLWSNLRKTYRWKGREVR